MRRTQIRWWQGLVAATAVALGLVIFYWGQGQGSANYLPATQAKAPSLGYSASDSTATSVRATLEAYTVMSATVMAKRAPSETAEALLPTFTPAPLPPTTTPVFGLMYDCAAAGSYYSGQFAGADSNITQYHPTSCWRGTVNGQILTVAGSAVATSTMPTAYVPDRRGASLDGVTQGVLLVFSGQEMNQTSLLGIYPSPYRAGALSIRAVNGTRMVVAPELTEEKNWPLPDAYVFDLVSLQYVTPTPAEIPEWEAGGEAFAEKQATQYAAWQANANATSSVVALTPSYTPAPATATETPEPSDTPYPGTPPTATAVGHIMGCDAVQSSYDPILISFYDCWQGDIAGQRYTVATANDHWPHWDGNVLMIFKGDKLDNAASIAVYRVPPVYFDSSDELRISGVSGTTLKLTATGGDIHFFDVTSRQFVTPIPAALQPADATAWATKLQVEKQNTRFAEQLDGTSTPQPTPTLIMGIFNCCSPPTSPPFLFNNGWRGIVNGRVVEVLAGVEDSHNGPIDESKGLLYVYDNGPELYHNPPGVGDVAILSGKGTRLYLGAWGTNKATIIFDVATRKFLSP